MASVSSVCGAKRCESVQRSARRLARSSGRTGVPGQEFWRVNGGGSATVAAAASANKSTQLHGDKSWTRRDKSFSGDGLAGLRRPLDLRPLGCIR